MDKEWTGTFTIAEVCGKGLYSLKNAHGKVFKKKYNSIQLKTYEERQGLAAASDEDIESKVELDGTNSHNDESASKERPDVTDSHNEKICNGNEMSTHGILNEQLFSPHLFRLWRTGADELAFKAAEDEDFDVSCSTLYLNTGSIINLLFFR